MNEQDFNFLGHQIYQTNMNGRLLHDWFPPPTQPTGERVVCPCGDSGNTLSSHSCPACCSLDSYGSPLYRSLALLSVPLVHLVPIPVLFSIPTRCVSSISSPASEKPYNALGAWWCPVQTKLGAGLGAVLAYIEALHERTASPYLQVTIQLSWTHSTPGSRPENNCSFQVQVIDRACHI